MRKKHLTLEAVKEQFCTEDKQAVLDDIREQLNDFWDMDNTMELMSTIGEEMEKQIEAEGLTWVPLERILWIVKEAFICGSMDMASKMLDVNDMGYENLAGEKAAE